MRMFRVESSSLWQSGKKKGTKGTRSLRDQDLVDGGTAKLDTAAARYVIFQCRTTGGPAIEIDPRQSPWIITSSVLETPIHLAAAHLQSSG